MIEKTYLLTVCNGPVSIKEARNSFSFFQTSKHILSLDTLRVIIS